MNLPRYRFDEFTVSPQRRVLLRNGREQPLIPRYFDLLVFLIERRGEAVHRRDIFDQVWTDVVVSDGALSQAIRTIRRVLGDDSREPRFVRTVSRHGYRFIFAGIIEEDDDGELTSIDVAVPEPLTPPAEELYEPLLQRITRHPANASEMEEQREAAESLHALGTSEALRRLDGRPGHARGRALLRDTRWDVAEAGPVPIIGQPGALATMLELVRLRVRLASALASARSTHAAVGAGVAGLVAGVVGGVILTLAPGSMASLAVVPVLTVVGAGCGAIGGAGVGAGLSLAESTLRSRRALGLLLGGAFGGGTVGLMVQWLSRWTLASLVGVKIASGGTLEGLLIGAAAGGSYAIATAESAGGMAAPRGRQRAILAMAVGAACGLAALALALTGHPLVGGTIHLIAQASSGAQASMAPLGRIIGEPDFGRVTSALLATGEGALFGMGLALGLTRRT